MRNSIVFLSFCLFIPSICLATSATSHCEYVQQTLERKKAECSLIEYEIFLLEQNDGLTISDYESPLFLEQEQEIRERNSFHLDSRLKRCLDRVQFLRDIVRVLCL